MTSILHSSITAPGDTESSFFPVPESMRDRSERRRMMVQDLIDSAFTGVPRGFYRAYAMSSTLQQSPTTVRDTFAEGQAAGQLEEEDIVEEQKRVDSAQPPVVVDGNRFIDRQGVQGSTYGRDEDGRSFRNRNTQ